MSRNEPAVVARVCNLHEDHAKQALQVVHQKTTGLVTA